MKPVILLLAVSVAAITSCTTSYKSGQTPDDVYYSPARPEADEYVRTEKEDQPRYNNVEDYYDDRYIRMKVRNRTRWSELDDWYYYENRYNYSAFHNTIYNPWTPYTYWNNYYNPYCHSCCVMVNTKTTVAYNKPRTFNLNAYNNNNSLTNKTYTNPKGAIRTNNSNNTYTAPRNSNSNNSNAGNILRDIFGGGNNSNSSSTKTPSSSSNNSSSSSPSSSGSSSGSAPVRKF